MKKLGSFIIPVLLLWSHFAASQPAIVKASVDKNKILLGEHLVLTLEARMPSGSVVHPFKIDSIPHFVILSDDSMQKTTINGVEVLKQYLVLTSFDMGKWAIPPVSYRPNVNTPSVLVEVAFSEPFDANQPYHDVQNIRSVPFDLMRLLKIVAIILGALLLIITVVYFLTQRKIKIAPVQSSGNPYERALKNMETIRKSNFGRKAFYDEIVQIFRTYVIERTGIQSMQQTSTDFSKQLKPFYKNDKEYEQISQVLLLSDFVKFAKYDPSENETTTAFDVIKRSIQGIEQKVNGDLKEKKGIEN